MELDSLSNCRNETLLWLQMPKATMNLLVNEEIKNKKINMAEFQQTWMNKYINKSYPTKSKSASPNRRFLSKGKREASNVLSH